MDSDSPDTFFVIMDLIACGTNAIVVQVQQIIPIISPITLFMICLYSVAKLSK